MAHQEKAIQTSSVIRSIRDAENRDIAKKKFEKSRNYVTKNGDNIAYTVVTQVTCVTGGFFITMGKTKNKNKRLQKQRHCFYN